LLSQQGYVRALFLGSAGGFDDDRGIGGSDDLHQQVHRDLSCAEIGMTISVTSERVA
jgi:hypothetical protein